MDSPQEKEASASKVHSSKTLVNLIVLAILTASVFLTPSAAGIQPRPLTSPDFSMTDDFNAMSVPQTTPNQSSASAENVYLTSLNGFQGTVTLSTIFSPIGPGVSFSPSPVTTLSSGSSAQITIAVGSTVAGQFSLNVTGTSGSLSHSLLISITVTQAPPDILLTPTYVSVRAQPGETGSSVFTVKSLYGFQGTVSFFPSIVDPALTPSFNPTSVSLAVNGSATTTVQAIVAQNAATGYHAFYINAQATGVLRVYQSVLSVGVGPSFSMSTNPNSLTLASGSTGISTINLASQADFNINATITFNVNWLGPNIITPIKPTVYLSSNPVQLPARGTAMSALTIITTGATLGDYDIVLHGGGCVCLLPTTDVRLTIVNDPPGVINWNSPGGLNTLSLSAQGSFTVDSSTNTLNGPASLVVTNVNTGQTLFSKTYQISQSLTGNTATFYLDAPTTSIGALCHANSTAQTVTCSVVVNADVNRDGRIDISDLVLVAKAFGSGIGTSGYSLVYDLNGDGRIDVSDLALAGAAFGSTPP